MPPPQPYTVVSAETVQAEVERQAHMPDNVRKLERSGKEERHLFIWIDRLHVAWRALKWREFEMPPVTAPNLPEAITTVWVAIEDLEAVVGEDLVVVARSRGVVGHPDVAELVAGDDRPGRSRAGRNDGRQRGEHRSHQQ
jgi:hypothetical protein